MATRKTVEALFRALHLVKTARGKPGHMSWRPSRLRRAIALPDRAAAGSLPPFAFITLAENNRVCESLPDPLKGLLDCVLFQPQVMRLTSPADSYAAETHFSGPQRKAGFLKPFFHGFHPSLIQ